MNPAQYEELRAALVQIDDRLERLETYLKSSTGVPTQPAAPRPAQAAGAVASDADLDSKWGDVEVRKDPPRWQGQSYVGARYSQAPAEYLLMTAEFLDWLADQQEKKQEKDNKGRLRAEWTRKDASRARGWLARLSSKQPVRGGAGKQPATAGKPPTRAPAYNPDAEEIDL